MAHVIGVCGRKGGSGKTTTAVHLAAELASRGKTVVLIDCDGQGSATHWAEPGNLPMPVHHLPIDRDDQVETWTRAVRKLAADYIVLDSPPHLNAALGGVVGLSDLAVVPCGPSGMELIATGEMVGLIRDVQQERAGLPRILLVPSRVDRRTGSGRELAEALAGMGEDVAPEIRARTAFSDAFNIGQWVGTYAAGSAAHDEMRALTDCVLSTLKKGKK